ncbi:MAG: glycosyltransferase N-terminal domain-containing protein [Calditrichia bacterium]
MGILLFLLYNILFIPLLLLLVHLVAVFNKKVRHGLNGRYRLYQQLRRSGLLKSTAPRVVFHCASMGEFEHIKPFLLALRKKRPDYKIIVLFFSPSGFENIKQFAAVDLFLYAPLDWFFPVLRFFLTVKPSLWIIAKHDVWPNQLWVGRMLKVPVFLINASLHSQSSRLLWFSKPLHQLLYRNFTAILTVSETDRNNFLQLVPPKMVQVAGDTKYDQVIVRRNESLKKHFLPAEFVKKRWVFVAGSTWPEDHQRLIEPLKKLLQKYPDMLCIICPHEPDEGHLGELKKAFGGFEPYILLSEIERHQRERVLIVDRIGVLANLYSFGKVAYVGGSFKQNIHNVLEPAVYGQPILFGPVNNNSYEAQLLKAGGGAVEIHSAEEFYVQMEKFLKNDIYRQEAGRKAARVVEENKGATEKTITHILQYLN